MYEAFMQEEEERLRAELEGAAIEAKQKEERWVLDSAGEGLAPLTLAFGRYEEELRAKMKAKVEQDKVQRAADAEARRIEAARLQEELEAKREWEAEQVLAPLPMPQSRRVA